MIFPTPLRYKLFNSAAASVAILILYGTVGAVALQEPAVPHPARPEPLARTSIVARPTLGQIAAPAVHVLSVFQREQNMSHAQLMKRWEPLIKRAARRFDVPASWIREVMRMESGGRTMLAEKTRVVSSQGALGLMQVQPGTYSEMRAQYGLGPDPFDPHDNIFAATAYLRWLRGKYGYPTMFEAYNDGPGNLEQRLTRRVLLPAETRNYVSVITVALGGKLPIPGPPLPGVTPLAPAQIATTNSCAFTRPDGSVLVVDCAQVTSVRAPQVEDSATQAQSIVTIGSIDQGVRESEEVARRLVLSNSGHL